ncbi:hypothetical protein GGI35DRAFT_219731 [Trichoderma velutinum]
MRQKRRQRLFGIWLGISTSLLACFNKGKDWKFWSLRTRLRLGNQVRVWRDDKSPVALRLAGSTRYRLQLEGYGAVLCVRMLSLFFTGLRCDAMRCDDIL